MPPCAATLIDGFNPWQYRIPKDCDHRRPKGHTAAPHPFQAGIEAGFASGALELQRFGIGLASPLSAVPNSRPVTDSEARRFCSSLSFTS